MLWQASQPNRKRLMKRLADTQDPLLVDAPMAYYMHAGHKQGWQECGMHGQGGLDRPGALSMLGAGACRQQREQTLCGAVIAACACDPGLTRLTVALGCLEAPPCTCSLRLG